MQASKPSFFAVTLCLSRQFVNNVKHWTQSTKMAYNNNLIREKHYRPECSGAMLEILNASISNHWLCHLQGVSWEA